MPIGVHFTDLLKLTVRRWTERTKDLEYGRCAPGMCLDTKHRFCPHLFTSGLLWLLR